MNLIPKLDAIDNTTTDQHHMLDDHHNTSTYDGCVRSLYADVQQQITKEVTDDLSHFINTNDSSSDSDKTLSGNVTEIQVYGLDRGVHLSALGVTIAVGCSLLMLNAVVFAAIYYQKDKINVAKNMQKAWKGTKMKKKILSKTLFVERCSFVTHPSRFRAHSSLQRATNFRYGRNKRTQAAAERHSRN
ncbi:uncharacterized protein TNIN_397961 [Trichonephila inaurata madagascariensis]|uniref:Uncharacterized protein n=1 Tax=Trichonephila inaurata madagascariensis TaxID=2747483 RepID=A0A8X6XVE2_9ARAC|nr:uncharacterized protein TNIN_397961 [Trichonephila inaurata madagascariensis]